MGSTRKGFHICWAPLEAFKQGELFLHDSLISSCFQCFNCNLCIYLQFFLCLSIETIIFVLFFSQRVLNFFLFCDFFQDGCISHAKSCNRQLQTLLPQGFEGPYSSSTALLAGMDQFASAYQKVRLMSAVIDTAMEEAVVVACAEVHF